MLNRLDTDIIGSTDDRFFSSDYVFDFKQGLNYAVAFSAYDSNQEIILDPSYGELRFRAYTWGRDPVTDESFVRFDPIPTHPCTREELGLEGKAQSRFFPIIQDSFGEVGFYHKKFICVDKEYLKVYGDFSSRKASLMQT